jgi:outer membrane protein assembly factor BamB
MTFGHRRGILVAGLFSVNAMAAACATAPKTGPARQESGWPVYLGNQRHDAAVRETLNPDPRPLWHIGMGRGVRGSPALGEAVIAVGTADRNLVLVDRGSGEVLWRTHLDGSVRAGPLIDEDRLYVATESPQGRVYAVRLRDGRQLWRTPAGSVTAPITFDGEAIYAATEQGLVLRLEPDHGTVQWRRPLAGAVRAGPLVTPNGAGLVVATTSDTLYLLDRQTGAVRSQLTLPGAVLATPATDGRRVYLATTNGRIVAVDLVSWSVAWDRAAGDAVYGAPALIGDTLLVLARNGRLWMIPVDTPDNATSQALDIVATAGPTPVASGVLVGSVSGEVLLVDPKTGAIRWRAQVAGPIEEPPLVRDRQVVVVAGRGNIHTYR